MTTVAEFHTRECSHARLTRLYIQMPGPDGTSDYIPLRSAVEKLGKAMYPSNWDGYEQLRTNTPSLPNPIQFGSVLLSCGGNEDEIARWSQKPTDAELQYASRLLLQLAPELAPPAGLGMIAQTTIWPPASPSFTVRQWRVAQELADQRETILMDERARLYHVTKTLKSLCVEKRIKTVLRAVAGGDFTHPLEWWAWNGENVWGRFSTYRMNPNDIFCANPLTEATHWIFVDAVDLDREIRRLDKKPPAPNEVGATFISPSLQCALDTACAMKIDPSCMPKLSEIEAEVPNHWRGEHPLSASRTKAIARMIRDEESRLGRASKHEAARQRKNKAAADGCTQKLLT